MEWRQFVNLIKFSKLLTPLAKLKTSLALFSSCDLCGLDVEANNNVSTHYQQHLVCQYCLNALPWFEQEVIQGNLLMWPAINRALPGITFDQLFALAPYVAPFNHWLVQLKYHGRFELGQLFAALLAKQWHVHGTIMRPDVVLSVPLHLSKWRLRGYNQAHLIAQPFANALQLQYLPNALIRIKKNESQMGKTGALRRKNLNNAFKLNQDFTDIKHVILIDDVVTTGTTASEVSRLLKSAGVQYVSLVTVCLTLPEA